MQTVFSHPASLRDKDNLYCPGCPHGIIHRLIGEVQQELGVTDRSLGFASVGCAVLADFYLRCEMRGAPAGSAPQLATQNKQQQPDWLIFTYQGAADLTCAGANKIIEAAQRGEKITVIYINNELKSGLPKLSEKIASLDLPTYVARTSVHRPQLIVRTKHVLRRAFDLQKQGRCFSLVEVLSTCPTNWGKTPTEALVYLQEKLLPVYPLGVFKDPGDSQHD